MAELITTTTFAKWVGVSETAIRKAVKANRIDVLVIGKKKRINWNTELPKFVRSSTSKVVLERFKNINLDVAPQKTNSNTKKSVRGSKDRKRLDGESSISVLEKSIDNMNAVDASELSNIIKAKRQQMEYEKERGNLIELDDIVNELQDVIHKMKSSLFAMPDRISVVLENQKSEFIYTTLNKEIEYAFKNLSMEILDVEDSK